MLKTIVSIVFLFTVSTAQNVWVNTTNGAILGKEQQTIAGVKFSSFMGIPYAEPPIGELRFQPPVPKASWNNSFWDATAEKGSCFQVTTDNPNESEDCLYMNIYTPAVLKTQDLNASLPVMFFIHGGGFISDSSNRINYGPEHLMEKNIILVTFNYRIGPFGFFTTGDAVLPGNAGLKDQVLALKWVHENIQNFGGDPEKITISGHSSGAASVAYLSINPKVKGLYRAAIAESGTFLNPWAFQTQGKKLYRSLAATINPEYLNDSITSQELVRYLISLPAKTIDAASAQINQKVYPSFVPTLEVEHDDAAITKPMYGLLEAGKVNSVPLLMGFNSEEANYVLDELGRIEKYAAAFDLYPSGVVPEDMNILTDAEKVATGLYIKKGYVANGTFATHIKNCISYFSDNSFARGILKHAKLQSLHGPVFVYRFAYKGVLGGYSKRAVPGFSEEVRHGEEMGYIMTKSFEFYNTTDLSKFPEMDQVVQKRVITLFTNFIKYLNPTPEKEELFQDILWTKVETKTFPYLDIGSSLKLNSQPKKETFATWEYAYSNYGVPPFITY